MGYAQALLLNYEKELTATFGADFSLGEQLRFPIFIGAITALGQAKLKQPRDELPKDTRNFVASIESHLDKAIIDDRRYEFRINLIPKLGPKTEADASMSFVRESDLTDAEREMLAGLHKAGRES